MDASATANLTFSSTLLDEIYRSIDEQSTVSTETTRKKQSKSIGNTSGKSRNCYFKDDDERRTCLYQKWKDNRVCEKPVTGRSSTADLERSSTKCKRDSFCFNSSPSSCDFRGGGCCSSSSEAESVYGVLVKPKPIRTIDEFIKREKHEGKSKHEGKFVNTKSKALKIYSDLKKMKQPISPGGRLTSFLNSIFTTGNNKKPNASTGATAGDHTEAIRRRLEANRLDGKSHSCSSASSFSRSCLNNTTSSGGKFSNEITRSVKFYPVSVIADEETSSNSDKLAENSINKGVKLNFSDENNRVSEAARNLLRNYQKKVECELDSVRIVEDESQYDEVRSDSSSDLFELDNLSPMRVHSDQEELPLYATTRLQATNLVNSHC